MAKLNLVAEQNTAIFRVTIVNRTTWAVLDQTNYQVFSGNDLTIPISYKDDSDYTCISASTGTLTQSGLTVQNVTQDVTITLEDAKWKAIPINDDPVGISSITPSYQFADNNSSATFRINFNSGYADTNSVKCDVGTVYQDQLEFQKVSPYTYSTVTKITHTVDLSDNINWTNNTDQMYTARHGMDFIIPITYTQGADSTCLTTLEGYQATSGGISMGQVNKDEHVTAVEAKAQIKFTGSPVPIMNPSTGYAQFNSSMNFNVTIPSPFTISNVSFDKGTLSGSTLTVPTTNEKYMTVNVTDNLTYKSIWGSYTSSSSYFPLTSYHRYSQSEFIYTAAEIGRSGTIGGIVLESFRSNVVTRAIRVYIGHTQYSDFNSRNYLSFSSSSYKFNGSIVLKQGSILIPFDYGTFEYNGVDNLVIMINDTTGNTDDSISFGTFSTSNYQSAYIYGNSSYYPNYTYSYNRASYKPQIKLVFL